jgi:dTDP-4-dehydrorhamnose 3,5-epimerase-like enzyme
MSWANRRSGAWSSDALASPTRWDQHGFFARTFCSREFTEAGLITAWPLPVAAISDKDAAWPLVDWAKGVRI